jgi:Na+/H+ antiporter NhaD/arsenite permease-like protein
MIPVLEYMERSAGKLGLSSDLAFYWGTGLLSGLLDDAPTYLAFFAAALGRHGLDIYDSSHISSFISENGRELIAISLGATFLAR